MAITLDGVVSGPSGFLNGAQVDAWYASRFTAIPAAGDVPPAGLPDAGPVLTGTDFGGPGQWQLAVPTVAAYYVRVTYPVGATNAKSYWAYDNSLVLTQGNQGAQGAQGVQGYQGATGPQGSQGSQGVQGSTGSQGYQGSQGVQGATGAQGSQGTQGVQGSQGTQGFQGNQGFQGTQGSASTVQGPQGYQGFQGLTGPQGNQGTMGNTGAQGAQGYQGHQGYQGPQGYQGDMGNQGAQGYQGYQGDPSNVQGPQGYQGRQGATGAGAQGPQGNQGIQGPQGNAGPQGIQGPQGVQGPQGSQGYQGTIGPQGSQGFQGSQGSQGPQGATGSFSGTLNQNLSAASTYRLTNLVLPLASTDAFRADQSPGLPSPSIHTSATGFKVWNADLVNAPSISSQTQTMSSGTHFFTAISVPYQMSITQIWNYQITGAVAGASGAFYGIGIYDTSGNLLASTTNIASTAPGLIGLTGPLGWSLSSTYSIAPGNYMIGFLWYSGTGGTPTVPILGKPSNAITAQVNANCPTPTSGKLDQRACSTATGRTTLYTSLAGVTPTAGNANYWVALS